MERAELGGILNILTYWNFQQPKVTPMLYKKAHVLSASLLCSTVLKVALRAIVNYPSFFVVVSPNTYNWNNSGDPQAKISYQDNNNSTCVSILELLEWCHSLIIYCLLFCGVIWPNLTFGQTSQIRCFTTKMYRSFTQGRKHNMSYMIWLGVMNISVKKSLTWRSLHHGWLPKTLWSHIHNSECMCIFLGSRF